MLCRKLFLQRTISFFLKEFLGCCVVPLYLLVLGLKKSLRSEPKLHGGKSNHSLLGSVDRDKVKRDYTTHKYPTKTMV